MSQPIWKPSKQRIESANLTRFMTQLAENGHGDFADYDALWDWSVENLEDFWAEFWDFGGVIGTKGEEVLENPKQLMEARFFPDAKVNFAENILAQRTDGVAIIFHSEIGERSEWSWDELVETVSRLQQALKDNGVGVGDRVAGIVPNSPHTIAAMLAVTSLGAIWSSCSPDFGFNAAMDRISQIEPKVLFSADGYTYNGKEISSIETVAELTKAIPSIERTIVFPLLGGDAEIGHIGDKGIKWDDYIQPFVPMDIHYERVAFDAPLYIMFSVTTLERAQVADGR